MFKKMNCASAFAAAGSILNINPANANVNNIHTYQSDLSKLTCDWSAIGKDFVKAIETYESTKFPFKKATR